MGRSNAKKLLDDVVKKNERTDQKREKKRQFTKNVNNAAEEVVLEDGPPKLPSIGTANRDPVQLQINIFCGYFFLACWWNFRHKKADLPYSDDDPNAANILLVVFLCTFLIVRKLASDVVNGLFALLSANLIVHVGCIRHFERHTAYAYEQVYMPEMWKYTVLVNLIGVGICFYYSVKLLSSLKLHTVLLVISTVVVAPAAIIASDPIAMSPLPACARPSGFSTPAALQLTPTTSRYIPLEDGTRLAADIYLPTTYHEGSQYPTVIFPTRYTRSSKIRWPFNKFQAFHSKDTVRASVHLGTVITELVHHGYVVVAVDIRGTGASFGTRLEDLHPRETKDSPQIVSWVALQAWSNASSLGTSGFLYDGAASAAMASRGGIAAAAILFPTLDTYNFLLPGGIPSIQAVRAHTWLSRANHSARPRSLAQTSPLFSSGWTGELVMEHAVGGPVPVEGWEHDVDNAMHAHRDTDVTVPLARKQVMGKLLFADDVFLVGKSKNLSIAELGFVQKTTAGLRANAVQTFIAAGYTAGHTASEGVELHQALGADQSRLLLGPWGAGATTCYESGLGASVSSLPLAREVRAFFDAVLKPAPSDTKLPNDHVGVPVGAAKYYVTGGGGWRQARAWPPPAVTANVLHPTTAGVLAGDPPQADNGTVDVPALGCGSGTQSRWNVARAMMGLPVKYSAGGIRHAVVFVSPVLNTPLTVVGAPVLSLRLEPTDGTHTDVAVFAYLEEEVASQSSTDTSVVHYVSEGQARASLATSAEDPTAPIGHPQVYPRSYTRDGQRMLHGPTTVAVAMETIAHTFAAGSRVRLSLADTDVDNFDVHRLAVSSTWRLHVGNATFLSLPALQP
eukprot:m.1055555 g.1055555  ORF g.1055555 m.1055555 type:complete len:849 (-) comp24193_c0_seq1:2216-4762(-)